MSLNIFWDKITQEHAKLAQDFLNEQLRNAPIPDVVGPIVISDLTFGAEVIVMYREDSEVRISLLHSCPEMRDPSQRGLCNHSPLIAMELESEIGDSSQKDGVLRDLDKVERFLVDQIRKFLYEHMSYPRSYSIPLPKQGDGGKSETEGGGGAQGVTGGGEDVLSQEPSETDHTKWEGTA